MNQPLYKNTQFPLHRMHACHKQIGVPSPLIVFLKCGQLDLLKSSVGHTAKGTKDEVKQAHRPAARSQARSQDF